MSSRYEKHNKEHERSWRRIRRVTCRGGIACGDIKKERAGGKFQIRLSDKGYNLVVINVS